MTFNYDLAFDGMLANLHVEGRYRVFTALQRQVGKAPKALWHKSDSSVKEVTVWCSNDYLAMSQHSSVLSAMQETLAARGAGAGGTRNISGHSEKIEELQQVLAETTEQQAAILFTSGYVANEAALSTLAGLLPNCIVFSDAANHASMIHGISSSRATKLIFRHNDLDHLRYLLTQSPKDCPKIIAFESVYSMSGSFGKISEIVELAKEFNALTYLDETHAVGIYGQFGGGLAQKLGLANSIDVIQGGLGKGYGVLGGFIAARRNLIDVVRSYARGFIYTTALPPVLVAGALASVKHLAASQDERRKMREIVAATKAALVSCSLPIMQNNSHIIPLLIGNSRLCKDVSDYLLEEENIYLQPINFPTVPRGTERLRITPTPLHLADDIAHLSAALVRAVEKFGCNRKFHKSIQQSDDSIEPFVEAA